MKRYVKCDCCRKPIYFGSKFYNNGVHCGMYCSTRCYCEAFAKQYTLGEDEADNNRAEVFGDKEIANI